MRKFEDIDAIFLWRVVEKHWLPIVLCAFICSAGTYIACRFFIPPVYKAEISLFAWNEKSRGAIARGARDDRKSGVTGGESEEEFIDETKFGISASDIQMGNLLVNDYGELIKSRHVRDRVRAILDERLPEERNVGFRFNATLPRQTRFMKVAVYSTSANKAETAASVVADVFIDSVQDLMNIRRAKVVDRARVVGIVSPRTWLNSIVAFLLGGGGLFLIFLARRFFHHTLHSQEIVASELQLPTIGKIGEAHESANTKLVCLSDPKGDCQYRFNHIVEDFLLLQTNLHYSLAHKDSAQIILLSSARTGDGKTFVASNLGLTLAGAGKRVLVVNCDLRKVEFDFFDIPRSPGLVNFLLGESKLEEIVRKNVLNSKLSVINNGPIPPNPTYMLELLQNSKVIDTLGPDYDYIIIDAPPLQNIADSLLLSKQADGIVIVADSKRTPVNLVRNAVDQLHKINVNILGIVLNRYASDSAGYGYGYGYGDSRKES